MAKQGLIPNEYNLKIETNMETFSFKGHVDIDAEAKKPLKKVFLNAKELKIQGATVSSSKGIQQATASLDPKSELIALSFKTPINGKVTISIDFVGFNNDKMYGFYRSKYYIGSSENYLLTTQFEAADARAAFPCIDEPGFKAHFSLSLIIDKELDAISNMPIKETHIENGRKYVSFYKTPKMSTYLLYIGVGKFEYAEAKLGNLKLRAVVTPGKKALAKLPLEYGKRFIDFYQKYMGIKFPLPKMDFIAIPDFAAGAMENWGAITFRETAFLCDSKTPIANRQSIADTIAHELAHQWFGDLVTMKWWDDLWLNESFATFMSVKAVEAVFPSWKISVQYNYDTGSGSFPAAFDADQFKATHPINVKVHNIGEISEIFDRISYEKGSTILYMLEDYVGKINFRNGIRRYLKEHAYSNAEKADLWNALQYAAKGKKVSYVMGKWISLPGYPVVKVEKHEKGIALTQHRFTINGTLPGNWPIPIHYLSPKGERTILMQKPSIELPAADWIKLNYRQACFYKSDYPDGIMHELGNMVKAGKLSHIDAWGLENDLFSQMRCGNIKAEEYIDFVTSYMMDVGYPASDSVISHMNWLYLMAIKTKLADTVRNAALEFARHQLKPLGYVRKKNESNISTIMRSRIVSSLCLYGDKDANAFAARLFEQIKAGKEVDPNMKAVVYNAIAFKGSSKEYNYFLSKYKAETLPDEKIRLLSALSRFQSRPLLEKAFAFSMSDKVRLQDSYIIPAIASSTPAGKELILEWTMSNWQELRKKFDIGTHMLHRYVENLSGLQGEDVAKRIEQFFSKDENARSDIKREVAILLERIEANTRFIKANS